MQVAVDYVPISFINKANSGLEHLIPGETRRTVLPAHALSVIQNLPRSVFIDGTETRQVAGSSIPISPEMKPVIRSVKNSIPEATIPIVVALIHHH